MRIGFLARVGIALLGTSALGACGFLPASQNPDFTIAGSVAPQPADFRNADPQVNDQIAKLYCADGYHKLDEMTLPSDSGTFAVTRVECTPYGDWSFLPGFLQF